MSSTDSLRIWDLPTRLFHWLLALGVGGLIVTGNVGGEWMTWHFRLAYGVMALLLFRLVWGVVGGRWTRFTSFVPSPGRLWRYVRHGESTRPGHNPLGALSVLALLTVLILQVASGLFIDDEIANTGPLVGWAAKAWVHRASHWHVVWGKWALYGLVGLHILAIAFYAVVKKKRLAKAMVTGDAPLEPGWSDRRPSEDGWRQWAMALVVLAGAAWVVYRILVLGDLAPPTDFDE